MTETLIFVLYGVVITQGAFSPTTVSIITPEVFTTLKACEETLELNKKSHPEWNITCQARPLQQLKKEKNGKTN